MTSAGNNGAGSAPRPDVVIVREARAARLVELLRSLRRESPSTRALIVSARTDPAFICTILKHGARGCIGPDAPKAVVARAVAAIRAGDVWMPRAALADALAALVRARDPFARWASDRSAQVRAGLTRREDEIAAWVAQGLSNKEVARHLGVSHETVK